MNNVFNMWMGYLGRLPDLIIALLVLLVGWLIAKGIAKGVRKALRKTSLDDRLFSKMNINTQKYSSEEIISKVVFWILMIVVFVIFFNTLNMGGAVGPFTAMLNTLFGFLPNILGAVIVLAIGWIVARLVKGIVVGILTRVGTERLSAKVGLNKILEGTSLSSLIGTIVYILILIPVVITALETLELHGIAAPAIAMLNNVLTMIPNIIIAGILIAAGIWLGKWVKRIVSNLLEKVGINQFLNKIGVGNATQAGASMSPAEVLGYLAQIVVVLLFTVEALQLVGLSNVVGIINAILAYLPMVIAALVILGVGLYVANIAQKIIMSMIVQRQEAKLFGNIAKYIIIIFAVFMAVDQLQIANTVVNSAFILILGGIALAFGISFGLGGKEFAQRRLAKLEEKMDKTETKEPNKEEIKEEAKLNKNQPGVGNDNLPSTETQTTDLDDYDPNVGPFNRGPKGDL
ncbi:mechanosensitive ion channel [Alkalihalophilus sp. As8PL]|uniref:Mechanosensitive ion channel n=1 Tax=Alkalihalophilus sp. As8PL TaxID=3237103 RepID=A0AB39BNT5_9BACI